MKKLLLITALLIASNGLAQKYLSQYDIDEERFGNERIFTLSANDEPLEGAYKVAIGGGDYYEATFKKGRIDGAKKTYNDKGETYCRRTLQKWFARRGFYPISRGQGNTPHYL